MYTRPEPDHPKPRAVCDAGGCELFAGDACYCIEGLLVCEACLTPFVRRWLGPCRIIEDKEAWLCTH